MVLTSTSMSSPYLPWSSPISAHGQQGSGLGEIWIDGSKAVHSKFLDLSWATRYRCLCSGWTCFGVSPRTHLPMIHPPLSTLYELSRRPPSCRCDNGHRCGSPLCYYNGDDTFTSCGRSGHTDEARIRGSSYGDRPLSLLARTIFHAASRELIRMREGP